jgi:hypothetical protein
VNGFLDSGRRIFVYFPLLILKQLLTGLGVCVQPVKYLLAVLELALKYGLAFLVYFRCECEFLLFLIFSGKLARFSKCKILFLGGPFGDIDVPHELVHCLIGDAMLFGEIVGHPNRIGVSVNVDDVLLGGGDFDGKLA